MSEEQRRRPNVGPQIRRRRRARALTLAQVGELTGLNVGYLDGHVALFYDEDRSTTYWSSQTRYYGNGWAIYSGAYDQ